LSGLLIAISLVLALLQNPPTSLRRYLWAQLVYVPFVWAAYYVFGEWSVGYAVIYCIFTVIILLSVVGIVTDCVSAWRHPARLAGSAFLLAMVLTRKAFTGVSGHLDGYEAITLAEGFFLSWAGTLATFTAPYTKRPDLVFPLGMFWMIQAAYDFGWTLHGHLWDAVNWVIPPAMGVICFTFLAWRLYVVPRRA
jgi:hypothetical protein